MFPQLKSLISPFSKVEVKEDAAKDNAPKDKQLAASSNSDGL